MVKALFKSKPSEKDFVEIKQMKHCPFKGYLAMSWCGYLLTRYSPDNIDNETVNHETIHLMQAKDEGSWLKFYLKYLWEWIKGGDLLKIISFLLNCVTVFKKNLSSEIKHETVVR